MVDIRSDNPIDIAIEEVRAGKIELVPGRWQGALEMLIEGFYNMVEGASGPKWARRFFAHAASLCPGSRGCSSP